MTPFCYYFYYYYNNHTYSGKGKLSFFHLILINKKVQKEKK